MRKFHILLTALFVLPLMTVLQAPAHAQASRTWVSGVGDDVNPCSRTAPCKTFAGAMSKTATNGEIDCLDPAGYGAVTITKSITIDCHQTQGSILSSGTNGINIAYDSFAATDTKRSVRLRGLSIQGFDNGVICIRVTGGAATTAGSTVFIDQCLIDGVFGGLAPGVDDERGGGGELYIADTTIRNIGSIAIVVNPFFGASAGQKINVSIDNVRVENSNTGFSGSSGATAMISRSIFAGITGPAIFLQGQFSSPVSQVNVDDSSISNNGIGISNGGGQTTIVLSNNNIALHRHLRCDLVVWQ
jgi:hypothetical protein